VVCWAKFNASIEASRLPEGYRWIASDSEEAAEHFPELGDAASEADEDALGVVQQIHTTGFWVDETGKKLRGKMRFRIRNFDVGISGEHSYLSLEGTMLDSDGEEALAAEASAIARELRDRKGIARQAMRQVPEFSVTKFGAKDEEEETSNQRREVWKGSLPPSVE